jgi:hypothetical protein
MPGMAEGTSQDVGGGVGTGRSWAVVGRVALVVLHVIPLVLASTVLGVATVAPVQSPAHWNFGTYAHEDGFGYAYHSAYSLTQVLAYLLAYVSGLILYPRLTRPHFVSVIATALCLAGAVSFGVELSHWFSDHHFSLVVSLPSLLLPIAIWTIISGPPRGRRSRSS